MPLDDPALVVGVLEREQRLAQLLEGVEAANPQEVLLQHADEPLGAAVTLGLTDEGRRACEAEEADLTLKVVAHVLGAVIVAQSEAMGDVLGERAEALAHALTDRLECLEAIRQGIRERFGAFAKDIAHGLALRHDHGSQYVSHHFQSEIRFLGLASSPAFVREPEGNGCAERFIRVLKENLLWVRRFDTVEELRLALIAFKQTYNQTWIIERHGYRTPAQVRADQLGPMPMAA